MPELKANGRHRVVITGMGVMSPLGESVKDFWRRSGRRSCLPTQATLRGGEDFPLAWILIREKNSNQQKDFWGRLGRRRCLPIRATLQGEGFSFGLDSN